MSQASTDINRPPYMSYKTLRNFLESLKASGVPGRIDRSFVPTSMSGQNQVYLLATLRFFRLISETGHPESALELLVTLEGSERVGHWHKIFTDAYKPIIQDVDITRATTRMIEEKFKENGLSGDSVRKAITFFIHAAKDADIKVSPHVKAYGVSSNRAQRGRRPANRPDETPADDNGRERKSGETPPPPPPPPPVINASPYQVLIEILSPDMQDEEQQAVWTLIRYLKKKEADAKVVG